MYKNRQKIRRQNKDSLRQDQDGDPDEVNNQVEE